MESESAAKSDVVEPGQDQEEFSKYVSPPPLNLRDLDFPVSKESEASIQQIIRDIGPCRLVPEDHRISTSFGLNKEWFMRCRRIPFATYLMWSSIERLKQFSMIKNEHFQFEILDSNLANPAKPILACYKPEEENVILFENISILDIPDGWWRKGHDTAPKWLIDQWRRVIWCQGLSSVLDPRKDYGDSILCSFPYLISDQMYESEDLNIEMTIHLHLKCSKRLGSKSANPYYDQNNGFHIVFYEKIVSWKIPRSESWKTGKLYLKTTKGEVEAFRRSAFTILARSESRKGPQQEESELCWTLLLLTPSDFFPSHKTVDLSPNSPGPDMRSIVIQKCMLTAELTSILYAMKLVVERWEGLYQHIEGLLHEDFMDPATYVELLFDDENFSQSRLYFWVIGCVNEFQISIEDSIKQWTLFREARVESYLESNQGEVSRDNDSCSTSSKIRMGKKRKVPSPDEEINTELPFQNADVRKESESSASFANLREDSQKIKNLAKKIDVEVESLINWQSQFKHQQETAQAYRDGLFNASALMESRASTRLGENVKLLTYVSIFYLPLAFCAALWAIPDITSSGTRSPFILTTILVGFVTYMIVFNLGNIVKQSRRVYEPLRAGVIKQICKQSSNDKESRRPDESEWDKRAQRFESTFGPKRGDGEPSEWWISIYSMTIISKWFLVHFRSIFQWIGRFFWKIFAPFENAFQWMRQLLKFPRDSTSNNSQEDSTTNPTGEETV